MKGFRGYKLCRVGHENEPHYYLTTPSGEVLDPTSAQFKTHPPYDKGRGVGLPTPSKIPGTNVQSPTHGAKAIMERAKAFSRKASDRKALVRLASRLPQGSAERKVLLKHLCGEKT